jgi:hypothetical protein
VRLAHAGTEPDACTWLLAPAGKAELLELTVESITCVKPSTGQDGATDVLFMAIEIGAQIAAGAATGGASTGASAAATAAKAAASVSWAGVKAGAKAGAKAVTKKLVMEAAKKGALKAGVLTTGKVVASLADDSVAEALDVLSVKGAFNKVYGETPDDLYLKVDGRLLFPTAGTDVQLASQQTVQVGARHLFERSRGVIIELMEYDSGSDDDSLGAQTFAIPARPADFSGSVRFEDQIFDDEDDEGSLYLVTFSISELPSTL